MFLSILPALTGMISAVACDAGISEAEKADTLSAVTVVADRGMVVSRTDTVLTRNSISITDALSSVPGIYLCDYGALAGPKSVSLRGFGSPHTAIYLDGVRISNVQNGQADLGMLDLANCSAAVVDYAQNSISFNTAKPAFEGGRIIGGSVNFRGGSFGTYEPAARLDFKLTDRVTMSASATGTISKGDFTYGSDNARRENNDIKQIRTGLDFRGDIDGGHWHAKAYYNGSDRGTPGSVSWPSTDRQKDRNAFAQALVRKRFTPLYQLNISAKGAYDDLLYFSEWGDSRYRQGEAQINSSHRFSVCSWFDASIAADYQWDGLNSTEYAASRSAVTAAASVTFHPKNFKADIAVEYSGFFDRTQGTDAAATKSTDAIAGQGRNRNVVSPSIDLRYRAFKGFDITAFGRRAYRTPTFNELYYPGYGNPDLKAEDAWLTDVGLEYHLTFADRWNVSAKADGFCNFLKNKIVSAPTELDPSIWLPYNIGKARMAGADLQAGIIYDSRAAGASAGSTRTGGRDGVKTGLSARYNYNDAIDKTPDAYTYGQQIPFISKHTVCLDANASYRGWWADLKWNWRGGRYDSAGKMPDYSTLDLTAGKDIRLPHDLLLGLKFIARNLTDCRYELTSGYPMPGRSFFGEINFKF